MISRLRSPLALGLLCAGACVMTRSGAWVELFDGRSTRGWNDTEFGGEGAVTVRDGRLVLEPGEPLTGVTFTGGRELPRNDYEIEVLATRLDGSDFFCGLTFPVGESHCSLIVGGWGGSLVGLSSLDGLDASDNETGRMMRLENGRRYEIRVRVRPDRITAWIDRRVVVDVETAGREVSLRPEVDPSRPLGIAAYACTAAIDAVRVRRLDP